MAGVEPWQILLGAVVTVLGSFLVFRGVKFTAASAKEGVTRTADVDAQESALQAWQALLKPLQDDNARLNLRLEEVLTKHDRERQLRVEHDDVVQEQLTRQSERIDLLTVEVKHWKSMAKAIARWATLLRDQVIALKGSVPPLPDELLMAQLLDDADDT